MFHYVLHIAEAVIKSCFAIHFENTFKGVLRKVAGCNFTKIKF